jgi:hypothetical protein
LRERSSPMNKNKRFSFNDNQKENNDDEEWVNLKKLFKSKSHSIELNETNDAKSKQDIQLNEDETNEETNLMNQISERPSPSTQVKYLRTESSYSHVQQSCYDSFMPYINEFNTLNRPKGKSLFSLICMFIFLSLHFCFSDSDFAQQNLKGTASFLFNFIISLKV